MHPRDTPGIIFHPMDFINVFNLDPPEFNGNPKIDLNGSKKAKKHKNHKDGP